MFTVQGLTPGHDVLLIGRTDVMYVEGEIAVRVEGRPAIVFPDFAADRRYRWRNRAVPIPGKWVEGEALSVSVARVESTKDLSHFRYWVYQCERPVGAKDEGSTDGPDAAAPVEDDEDDSLVDPPVEVRVERQVVVEAIRPSFLEEALRGEGLFPGGGPGSAGVGGDGGMGGFGGWARRWHGRARRAGSGGDHAAGGGAGPGGRAAAAGVAAARAGAAGVAAAGAGAAGGAAGAGRRGAVARGGARARGEPAADDLAPPAVVEPARPVATERPAEPARAAEPRPATPPATEITRVEAPATAPTSTPTAAPAAEATPGRAAAGKAQRLVTITLRDDDARNGAVQEHLGAELADGWRIARVECVPHPTGGWLMVLLEREPR
ncbi:MAG: hypothetical protein R3F65_06770 [bacterium]